MLKPWMRILPLFVVEYLAKRSGERFIWGTAIMAQGTKNTYFRVG